MFAFGSRLRWQYPGKSASPLPACIHAIALSAWASSWRTCLDRVASSVWHLLGELSWTWLEVHLEVRAAVNDKNVVA